MQDSELGLELLPLKDLQHGIIQDGEVSEIGETWEKIHIIRRKNDI